MPAAREIHRTYTPENDYECQFLHHYFHSATFHVGRPFYVYEYYHTAETFREWRQAREDSGTFRYIQDFPTSRELRQADGIPESGAERYAWYGSTGAGSFPTLNTKKVIHRATVTPLPFPKEDTFKHGL